MNKRRREGNLVTRALTKPFAAAPATDETTARGMQAGEATRPHGHTPPEKCGSKAGPARTAERGSPTKDGRVPRHDEKL